MKLQWTKEAHAPSSFQVCASGRVVAPGQNRYEMTLTDQVAYGGVSTQELSPGMFLTQSEMNFKKDTVFQEQYQARSVLQFSFCMEGSYEWNYRENGSYQASPAECSIQSGILKQCDSYYQKGHTYRSVGISLEKRHRDRFMEYLEGAHLAKANGSMCTRLFASTPRIRLILQQLLDVPADQRVQKIYLEGKVLELLAVFCTDAVGKSRDSIAISKEDYRCILKAREMIDYHFLEPLTISQIAEASYLSETKLKQYFKSCFGCTVYDYIVEKRMEKAYTLLQSGKYKIRDIVWMVGYSNPSHFTESFRKRYGVNPSNLI